MSLADHHYVTWFERAKAVQKMILDAQDDLKQLRADAIEELIDDSMDDDEAKEIKARLAETFALARIEVKGEAERIKVAQKIARREEVAAIVGVQLSLYGLGEPAKPSVGPADDAPSKADLDAAREEGRMSARNGRPLEDACPYQAGTARADAFAEGYNAQHAALARVARSPAVKRMRDSIASGEVSIEFPTEDGGRERIEADGNGGVRSATIPPPASDAEALAEVGARVAAEAAPVMAAGATDSDDDDWLARRQGDSNLDIPAFMLRC